MSSLPPGVTRAGMWRCPRSRDASCGASRRRARPTRPRSRRGVGSSPGSSPERCTRSSRARFPGVASVEREIDKLFALPLEEFTAARNELAKGLAKDGDKERADEVRGLAKPSVPVWTINQLARSEKPMVRALLDAGAKLRRAQEQALGGGNPDALRSAQSEEREALRALTHRAGEILREAGKPAGQAVLERINGTLGAAAVTEEARADLKAGRLTSELTISGFESLAG